jgi:hypothetical protein
VIAGLAVNRLELDLIVGLSASTGREHREERRRVQVDVAVERRRGRPPRAGQRAAHRVEFRLTDDELARLEAVARDNGKPLATLIREAINEFVADYTDTGGPFVSVR